MTTRLLAILSLLAALSSLPSCSTYQWFRSRERVIADSPAGTPASAYAVTLPDGQIAGTVLVWSRGGRVEHGAGVIHLGFELRNLSAEPWRLDPDVAILRLRAGPVELDRLEPRTPAGAVLLGPGERKSVELFFAPGVTPREVESFDVHWSASASTGTGTGIGAGADGAGEIVHRYEQLTPFVAGRLEPWYWSVPNTWYWRDE